MTKRWVFAVWFITILALLPLSHAVSIGDVAINDTLFEDLSIQESVTLQLLNNTQSSFSFILPEGAAAVSVNGATATPQNNTVIVPLACRECRVSIAYALRDAVQPVRGGSFTFSRTLNLPEKPRSLRYSVTLPNSYGIGAADQTDPPVVPSPTLMTTDGQRIIVTWLQQSPQLPMRYYILYHGLETFGTWQEIRQEFGEWPVLVLMGFALLTGVAAGIIVERRRRARRKGAELPLVPASLLSPDEKTILKALRESKGATSQKELGKRLSWSKSKVSALMSNLEYKKIVKREKVGRNYKVELVKDVEE
jgi:uncharacterized membrane protein